GFQQIASWPWAWVNETGVAGCRWDTLGLLSCGQAGAARLGGGFWGQRVLVAGGSKRWGGKFLRLLVS
ncbi:hypothetical protein, partial [Kamptonema formosum]|uniref:hypothetical protein n=1 Tax=Kamptonema formosum TaxID=331992 RepID=UPI001E298DAC